MVLNQTDLDVRLQLTNCCIGTLTVELLNKIKIGAKDIDCKLTNLVIIEEMLEYLRCYKVPTVSDNINTTASISLAYRSPDVDSIQFFIDEIAVCDISLLGNISQVNAWVAQINTNQSSYFVTATSLGQQSFQLDFRGKCDTIAPIYFNIIDSKGDARTDIDLTLGTCSVTTIYDNCLTDDKVQAMFEWISTQCKLCFQYPGFSYE